MRHKLVMTCGTYWTWSHHVGKYGNVAGSTSCEQQTTTIFNRTGNELCGRSENLQYGPNIVRRMLEVFQWGAQ